MIMILISSLLKLCQFIKKEWYAAYDMFCSWLVCLDFFFSSILSDFRKHFNDILANKPANPPDFDVYEDMIDKKAEEAKKAIDNTAGASDADKQKAKDEVNAMTKQ